MVPLSRIHTIVIVALFAALIAAGALFALPIGTVPFSLQPVFIMLAGLCLGPRAGAVTVLLYLVAGAIGLPVFAGGKAGLGVLFGPTGGFLWGFVLTAAIAGLGGRFNTSIVRAVLALVAANVVMYAAGVIGLMLALDLTFAKAFAAGVAPFVLGEVVKTALAFFAWRFMQKRGLIR